MLPATESPTRRPAGVCPSIQEIINDNKKNSKFKKSTLNII